MDETAKKKRFYYRVEGITGLKFVIALDENEAVTKITDKYDSESYRFSLVDLEKEKDLQRIEQEKNQKPVKSITINIEWKKSRTWGSNPRCEAEVRYKDGDYSRSPVYTASGCGYDKESTVIADVFNDYLKYKLYQKINLLQTKKVNANGEPNPKYPYGLREWEGKCYYEGGIGTSCYYRIAEFIGGKFEHISEGKTFDVYKYTDDQQ